MNKYLKSLIVVGIICLVGALTYLFVDHFHPFGIEPWVIHRWLKKWFIFPVANLLSKTLINPFFLLAIAFTLLMERLMPAKKNQEIFSINFAQDIVWFFYETILQAIILTTYVFVLREIYNQYFSYLTVEAIGQFPFWARFAWGVLLVDFLYWLQHYFNHKVSLFWQFHTVHHSQKELNFFTDFRYHIMEYFVRHTVLTIPLLMLGINIPTIVWFSILRRQYTHFYHGNIKTNLGPLKYVLVTPQSHRIHHSNAKEHQDKNFGAIFSIWDFMFGTQYMGFDEYPETGIEDEEFPLEKTADPIDLITTPLRQMAYPFVKIFRKRNE